MNAVEAPIQSGYVAKEHVETCSLCEQSYAPVSLEQGRCETCRTLGSASEQAVPQSIQDDFRTVEASTNARYLVVYGKSLFGANELVVLDDAGNEVNRRKRGLIRRIVEVLQ